MSTAIWACRSIVDGWLLPPVVSLHTFDYCSLGVDCKLAVPFNNNKKKPGLLSRNLHGRNQGEPREPSFSLPNTSPYYHPGNIHPVLLFLSQSLVVHLVSFFSFPFLILLSLYFYSTNSFFFFLLPYSYLSIYSSHLAFQYPLLSPSIISIPSYFFLVFEPSFLYLYLWNVLLHTSFFPRFLPRLYTGWLSQTHTLSPSFFLSIFPSLSTKEISFSDWWILNYWTLVTAPANVIMMLSLPSTARCQKTNTNTKTITLHPSR